MKIKTSELIDKPLDCAVAKAEDIFDARFRVGSAVTNVVVIDPAGFLFDMRSGHLYKPSTSWSQGGPIIDDCIVELVRCQSGSKGPIYWEARAGFEDEPGHAIQYGSTPLIAAMRCFVASKLGDEVDVPEELLA